MLDAAAASNWPGLVAQASGTDVGIALIEGGGLVAALSGLLVVLVRGTGLPRDARFVLAGVLLLGSVTHLWAVVEWTTPLRLDQYVDLVRVVTPILWMFFVYAMSNELLRERLRREEEHRTRMMRELDHRVKNNLSAVIAMAEQTEAWSTDLKGFMRSFLGRVRALGRAHEALAAARWEGIDLERVVRITLAPYEGPEERERKLQEEGGERIRVEGAPVTLPAQASGAVCMTLHELATNAAKYGALSTPGGRVTVNWEVDPHGRIAGGKNSTNGTGFVRVRWSEAGGPPVSCGRLGLGTGLIRGIVEYELGGRVELDMAPEGVRCVLEVPLKAPREEVGEASL